MARRGHSNEGQWVHQLESGNDRLLAAELDLCARSREELESYRGRRMDPELWSMCCVAAIAISGPYNAPSHAGALMECCKQTESPIEQAMLLGLAMASCAIRPTEHIHMRFPKASAPQTYLRLGSWDCCDADHRTVGDLTKIEHDYYGGRLVITPQAAVERYRVDFLVEEFHWHSERECSRYAAAVECDGHDYHERTKEQALHDRARDRELQKLGLLVLRYPGSAIWSDPVACAREVVETVHGAYAADSLERVRRSMAQWEGRFA